MSNSDKSVCKSLQSFVLFLTINKPFRGQGQVVQSIFSLTSSLRGQPVKCFMTLQPNALIFFVEKMIETFALLQKLVSFFQPKILAAFRY